MFGNGAARTIRGGTGSGDPFNGGLSGGGDQDVDQSLRYHINILNAMETEGFEIVNRKQQMAWARCYDLAKREMKDQVMSVFAFPEEPLTTEKLEEYAKETETAICVISRNSGEGNDRFMKKKYPLGIKSMKLEITGFLQWRWIILKSCGQLFLIDTGAECSGLHIGAGSGGSLCGCYSSHGAGRTGGRSRRYRYSHR